jgi:hypothetical protein
VNIKPWVQIPVPPKNKNNNKKKNQGGITFSIENYDGTQGISSKCQQFQVYSCGSNFKEVCNLMRTWKAKPRWEKNILQSDISNVVLQQPHDKSMRNEPRVVTIL